MYCPNCGKPLRDGASFCGFCGKDLADRIKKTAPVHEVQITPSAPKVRITSSVPVSAVKFKFNKKLLLIPLILVLAVGMGTAANSMVQKPVLSCDAIEVRHPVTSKMSVTAKQTGGKLTNLVMIMTFETTSSLYADSTYLDYSGVINSYLNNNPDTRSVINVKWDKNTRSGNYTSTMTATLNLKNVTTEEMAEQLSQFNRVLFGEFFDYVYYDNSGIPADMSAKESLEKELTEYGFSCKH